MQDINGWQLLKSISEEAMLKNLPVYIPYAYAISIRVIRFMLRASYGKTQSAQLTDQKIESWILDHLRPVDTIFQDTSYLRSKWENDFDHQLHMVRTIELAELLFNLHTIPNIELIYKRIVSDPSQMEATILELEGIKVIWFTELPFKLILPGGPKKQNYECEVELPKGIACVEMKCKVETEHFSLSSLVNTLKKASNQLPEDHCGIIFIKILGMWVDSSEIRLFIEQAIAELQKTKPHIAEVIYYERTFLYDNGQSAYMGSARGLLNPNSPYADVIDGGLIKNLPEPMLNNRWLQFETITKESLKQRLKIELPDA
jgi:hypothetical protein